MKPMNWIASCTCTLLLFWSVSSAPAFAKPLDPERVYRPIQSKLQRQQTVPLRVPTYIPEPSGGRNFVAHLIEAGPNGYRVAIAPPDCQYGASACTYANVSARRVTQQMKPPHKEFSFMDDPNYQPTERAPSKRGYVDLGNGVRGYFVPWVLGASVSNAKVIWQEDGIRYTVGIKGGKKERVIRMAKSAIGAKQ